MDRYMILDEKLATIIKYKTNVLFYITINNEAFEGHVAINSFETVYF